MILSWLILGLCFIIVAISFASERSIKHKRVYHIIDCLLVAALAIIALINSILGLGVCQ